MSLRNLVYRLLRKGESVTGTDNIYLAKGGFWFSLAAFIASLSSLGLAILFSRIIPKDVYGTYQYLLSLGSLLALTSLTGMADALTQAVARGQDRSIFQILKTRLRWSLLGVAAGAMLGGYYLAHGQTDLGLGVFIVGFFFPINASLSAWADYLVGKKRFQLQNRLTIGSVIGASVALATAGFFRAPAYALALVFCLSYATAHLVSLLVTLKREAPKGGTDIETSLFGKKLTVLDVFSSVATYLDRVVIFTFLGARETAIYAFAIAPPEQLKGYLKNLYYLALPKIAERPLIEIRKTFFRKYFLLSGLVLAISLVYVAFAPLVYRLLFPAYIESVRLSQVFALSLVAVAVTLPLAVMNGHRRVAENYRYQILNSSVSIVLLIIFVWKWGLMGAILARLTARLFGFFYAAWVVKGIFASVSDAETGV